MVERHGLTLFLVRSHGHCSSRLQSIVERLFRALVFSTHLSPRISDAAATGSSSTFLLLRRRLWRHARYS